MRTSPCALFTVIALTLTGCQKDPTPTPDEAAEAEVNVLPGARVAAAAAEFGDAPDLSAPANQPVAHPADRGAKQLAAKVAPDVAVDEALVRRYLAYRRAVVERGEVAVEAFQKARAENVEEEKAAAKSKKVAPKKAASVVAQNVTEAFTRQMREIEAQARVSSGLSLEQVSAVGQVVGEVLSARQIWRMSGGDDAVANAKAALAKLSPKERERARATFAKTEAGFIQMRDAKSARARFGDAAVDAVLAHEEALVDVQKDGAKVMATVY